MTYANRKRIMAYPLRQHVYIQAETQTSYPPNQ